MYGEIRRQAGETRCGTVYSFPAQGWRVLLDRAIQRLYPTQMSANLRRSRELAMGKQTHVYNSRVHIVGGDVDIAFNLEHLLGRD